MRTRKGEVQRAFSLSYFLFACAVALAGAHITDAQQSLTPAEQALVHGSKNAILATQTGNFRFFLNVEALP
jgi:hypothetical protein